MKNMNFFIGLFIISTLLSCKPKDDDIIDPVTPCTPMPCPEDDLLDTIWTYRLHEGNVSGFNYGIAKIGDIVINNTTNNSGMGTGHVIGVSSESGELLWAWSELSYDHYPSFHLHEERKLVFVQNRREMASINVLDGKTHRSYTYPNETVMPFGFLIGEYYYFTKQNIGKTEASLMRSHIDDFINWEEIYTIKKDDVGGSQPNIDSYNLWIDPQSGDEILVFQHRMAFPVRVDLVGFNMTKGSVIWKHDDLAILKNSNAERIFILDGRAYFPGSSDFYCVDILSGEIEWTFYHPSGIHTFLLFETLYAEEENLLIVKDAGPNLFAFDPLSGEVVWQRTDYASSLSGGSPKYHNGIIYWTGSYDFGMCLNAVRAINGQKLWAERSRLKGHSQFNGDIAIDPERGVLYASDRYYLMAIKLYED